MRATADTIFAIVQQPRTLDSHDDETQITLIELAIKHIDERIKPNGPGREQFTNQGIAVMQSRRDDFVQRAQIIRERMAGGGREASRDEGSDDLATGSRTDTAEARIETGAHKIEVQIDIVDAKNGTRRKFRHEFLPPDNTMKIETHAALQNQTKAQDDIIRERGTLLWGIDLDTFGEYFTPNVEADGDEPVGVQQKEEDCDCCVDAYPTKDLEKLQCGHQYCAKCLSELFRRAAEYENSYPPNCCTFQIPLDTVSHRLKDTLIDEFRKKEVEWTTPNRTYCAETRCREFIPPVDIRDREARCRKCRTKTCTRCKKIYHHPPCSSETEEREVNRIIKREGGRKCPKCSHGITRTEGCNHMTCFCGYEFCYRCGAAWHLHLQNYNYGRCPQRDAATNQEEQLQVQPDIYRHVVPQAEQQERQRHVDRVRRVIGDMTRDLNGVDYDVRSTRRGHLMAYTPFWIAFEEQHRRLVAVATMLEEGPTGYAAVAEAVSFAPDGVWMDWYRRFRFESDPTCTETSRLVSGYGRGSEIWTRTR